MVPPAIRALRTNAFEPGSQSEGTKGGRRARRWMRRRNRARRLLSGMNGAPEIPGEMRIDPQRIDQIALRQQGRPWRLNRRRLAQRTPPPARAVCKRSLSKLAKICDLSGRFRRSRKIPLRDWSDPHHAARKLPGEVWARSDLKQPREKRRPSPMRCCAFLLVWQEPTTVLRVPTCLAGARNREAARRDAISGRFASGQHSH